MFGGEPAKHRRQRLHCRRYPLVQYEMESGRLDVVADPTLGVGYQVRRVASKLWSDHAMPAEHRRGDRVTEKAVGEQIAHRQVGGLVTQRAELACDDQYVRFRMGLAVVVRPVDRTPPCRAPELGDRQLF